MGGGRNGLVGMELFVLRGFDVTLDPGGRRKQKRVSLFFWGSRATYAISVSDQFRLRGDFGE